MATSDLIAEFILNAIDDSAAGSAELRRGALAEMFSCVPSQINYVIATRFTPEHGYLVESRRGGGGYIRISRVRQSPRALVMHTVNAIGSAVDMQTASAYLNNIHESGLIDRPTVRLMLAAVGDPALRPIAVGDRDTVRASVLKQLLVTLISE